jgi:ABC-type lipoprotein release transport system permease subunit
MKKIFSAIITKVKDPVFWKNIIPHFIHFWPHAFFASLSFSKFFILLLVFMLSRVLSVGLRIPILKIVFVKIFALWDKSLKKPLDVFLVRIDKTKTSEIKRSYLITVAYRNLLTKKTRSLITIAGMSVGVGIIVLLLSLGYGIEKLIINQVASLEELKIVDVSTGGNTSLRLSSALRDKIKKIANVEDVIPLISIVGRVTFNNANTDIVVFAAPNSYLEQIKIKLNKGKLFAKNDMQIGYGGQKSVAGISSDVEQAIYGEPAAPTSLFFTINPEKPQVVWSECSTNSEVLGFVPHIEGGYTGREYWGTDYSPFEGEARAAFDSQRDEYLGKWVKGKVALYLQSTETEYRPARDEGGRQKWVEGCMQKNTVQIVDVFSFQDVLGEATESASLTDTTVGSESAEFVEFDEDSASSAASIELIDLQASSAAKLTAQADIEFKSKPSQEAVVSQAMINLLGIKDAQALGSKFKVSFVVSKSLFPQIEGKAKTKEMEYSIIGVIDDVDQPYFYVPIGDIQKLGGDNYSQMKIVLSAVDSVSKVRKEVESLGLRTASTADTVAQIESLFANLRIVLGLLGLVALGVASLGMFNTLTVSLLERTREIGGMKTMGMVSDEVQDLFLAEAMFMGLTGGIGGLIAGFVIGKGLSVLVSFIALTRGQGFLDLTYIPPFLIVFILVSSFFVGLITGLYPARRAKKISALNALRYE